jgi:hypothetical protein
MYWLECHTWNILAILETKIGVSLANKISLEPLFPLDRFHCVASMALRLISLSGRRGQFHLLACVRRRRQKSPRHALAGFAHQEFAASGHREYRTVPRLHASATSAHRRLTPRSSGAPTAWGPGRAVPHFVIMHRAARAPRRRLPLSSNVRPHKQNAAHRPP